MSAPVRTLVQPHACADVEEIEVASSGCDTGVDVSSTTEDAHLDGSLQLQQGGVDGVLSRGLCKNGVGSFHIDLELLSELDVGLQSGSVHSLSSGESVADSSGGSGKLILVFGGQHALCAGDSGIKSGCQSGSRVSSIPCLGVVDSLLQGLLHGSDVDIAAHVGEAEVVPSKPVGRILLQLLDTDGHALGRYDRDDPLVQVVLGIVLEDSVEGIGVVGAVAEFIVASPEEAVDDGGAAAVDDGLEGGFVGVDEVLAKDALGAVGTTGHHIIGTAIAVVALHGQFVGSVGDFGDDLRDLETVGVPDSV